MSQGSISPDKQTDRRVKSQHAGSDMHKQNTNAVATIIGIGISDVKVT